MLAMLPNATVLVCWLIWWRCCEREKFWPFVLHSSNCVFQRRRPCSLFFLLLLLLICKQNEIHSYTDTLNNFILGEKCDIVFRMTLLDSDTLLCLIKLINCLIDNKSANKLMGPGVLCWFKGFHITLWKVYGTNSSLISVFFQLATYSTATYYQCF